MRPYEAEPIAWDEGNEDELAGHHVTESEVMQVWDDEGVLFVPNKKGRAGNYKMIGRTFGGRALTIVVPFDEETRVLRPITGWDTTTGERTRYL